jgi:3-oxoacyl-[acyl-carrier-protein] synthase-3
VCHQANLRIIDFVVKRLKADKDKFFVNLDKYGNTSAASIAIALDEINKNNLIKAGDKIILVGFGGGLTYGAALIEWTINK